jgi:hypothetical protein
MDIKSMASGAAMALSMTLLGAGGAHANVTLTYTGNNFTNFSPPYSAADSVSGVMQLAGPLAANLSSAAVTPLSFDFFDGVDHITDGNWVPGFSTIEFTTDNTGKITGWSLNLFASSLDHIITENGGTGVDDDGANAATSQNGYIDDHPGTWTGDVAASVPEPAAWTVLLTGLCGMGAVLRSRRVRTRIPAA